jgi:hypothetical protein
MAAAKKKRKFVVLKSYRFVGKDPIIAALRPHVLGSGQSFVAIEKGGGPRSGTLRNWFKGKTLRPQFCTIAATCRTIKAKTIQFDSRGIPKIT